MSSDMTSHMVATEKLPIFSGNKANWLPEKSAFLAQAGKSGTDEIFLNTYTPYVRPAGYGRLEEQYKRQEDERARVDAEKLKNLRKNAWSQLHFSASKHFASIIRLHDSRDLEVKAHGAYVAITEKMETLQDQREKANVLMLSLIKN